MYRRPEDLHSSSISSSSGSRVWKGNIFAQDVALVAVDAYHLSGSMKFVKSVSIDTLNVSIALSCLLVFVCHLYVSMFEAVCITHVHLYMYISRCLSCTTQKHSYTSFSGIHVSKEQSSSVKK